MLSLLLGAAAGRPANRLVEEKSPYLQQHAHNPVDWYPWSAEAIDRARAEKRPIFLSIGYSTCHWCHVMERESFENEEIARLINANFVAIKVDREERPDVDHLYMEAVQAMTGQGGWPMTVILTPELKPFFAGTYFPPEERWGRPGLKGILEEVAALWAGRRQEVIASGERIAELLQQRASSPPGGKEPSEEMLHEAARALRQRFDPHRGGFGDAPKFPTPHNLTFLLRYARRTGDADAIAMVRSTLDAMAAGGIHDQLGGGFHRYSTDADWRVPHFEKMLYDQAGLALAYTDAYLVTGEPAFADVTRGILDYVLTYLLSPDGGFFSAEDADSEGKEGTFYVWTRDEIRRALGPENGERFAEAYRVTREGNWEGKNILHRQGPFDPGLDPDRRRLLEIRDQRIRPHRDEKVIVAWNGFMMEALARAGRALTEPRYVNAARRAAAFVDRHLWRDGRLRRHYRDGAADAVGYLDDYAYLGRGRLALYEATGRAEDLEAALHAAREMIRLFALPQGGFAFTGSDADALIHPVIEVYDGAMPSGNAVASLLLQRLGHLTADRELEEHGRRVIRAFRDRVERAPSAHVEMLSALDFALGPVTEIVIAGAPADDGLSALRLVVDGRYLPNAVLAYHPPAEGERLRALIPYLASQPARDGEPTAYVCRNYACDLPVRDAASLDRQLRD